VIDIITYKKENEILYIFDNNIEHNKYFNVVFFNYDNKEDAFAFLKSFIENADDKGIAKNNSEYPCFIFFKNKNFNKEILYSYYLENTKEMKISSYYDLKSHNIYFINDKKYDIKKLLSMDIINYFYGYDFQGKDDQSHKIRILFFGQAGSGKSTFVNYLLGKQKTYCSSMLSLHTKGGEYTHSKYPILMKDTKGFEINMFDSQYKLKNIIDEVLLNNIIHIVFYLISGPFDGFRDLDYSSIGSLIKFEEHHIHYYIIMTKDRYESIHFAKTSVYEVLG
jgi:GTP-binding protein EngB required for normal cell division